MPPSSLITVAGHHQSTTTMNNPCLLSLAPLLLLLAVSSSLPLTAAFLLERRLVLSAGQSLVVECIGDGVYAANSTYQANLRRVAALLLADAEVSAATPGRQSYTTSTRAVGYWPNRVVASSFCWLRRRDVNGTGLDYPRCADCVVGAFLEVERACPYHREAFFSNRNCTLQLAEIRILGGTGGVFGNMLKHAMGSGLVLQAIGFGWLFFLLFQEWRSRKRGTLMAEHTSAPADRGATRPSPPSPLAVAGHHHEETLAVSSSLPLTAVSQHYWLIPAEGQSPVAECTGDGVYAANSTYEANLRRAAALLLSEVSATPGFGDSYVTRAVGYWPNRLAASSFCWTRRRDVNGTGGFVYPRCADCIAGAFREVERACPYRREASFLNRNCSLELAEIRIFGTGGIFEDNILKPVMASGLVFQAIGFGCLFFLLFQEWRSRKRGTLMHSTPLLSGDENVDNTIVSSSV